MLQNYSTYNEQDYRVWKLLYDRQLPNLERYACKEYLACLQELSKVINANEPPEFARLNPLLKARNGWSIEVVPGFLPVDEFFTLLADQRFCSSTWLRKESQLDYLEEPDMFHDTFGHIPLFMNKEYAKFAQKLGEMGVRHADDTAIVRQLQRLYWFTIEFGLIRENGATKIYGAGIASSSGEIAHIFNHPEVEILPFDIDLVINNDFITSEIQMRYYEIESFEQLYATMQELEARFAAAPLLSA